MKKTLSRIVVFMLMIVMAVSAVNIDVKAASYPSVFFYKDADFEDLIIEDTAIVGDTVFIRMYWFAKFNNEGYDLVIYDSDGHSVATDSQTFTNVYYTTKFTIRWDTTGLPSGKYTVEVTKKFYSYYRWNEAPTKDKLYITLKDEIKENESKENEINENQSNENESNKNPTNVKGLIIKNSSSKAISVTYGKSKNTKKYQIQYSTDVKFRKNVKTKTTTKTSCKITSLKKNKTYYVRVRAINGNKFSSWTKAQKVAIKK